MSIKILLDPIVTASPSKCSTLVQFYNYVKKVLYEEKREDVFFYWTVPDFVTAEEFEFYPKHPSIEYIWVPQHFDRTKEYLTVTKELDDLLAFNGSHWDFDVVLTVRTGLAPLYRMIMNSPRLKHMEWMKQLWLIEEMPLMEFKKTVAVMDHTIQDKYTLLGYLAADRVCIISYHEKRQILQSARTFMTPSHVIQLDSKIKEIVSATFNGYQLKDPKHFFKEGSGKPFCIAYVGRMEKVSSRLEDLNKLMTSKYAMKGSNVRLLVCTVSKIVKVFDQSAIEVKFATREEFYQHAKEDMHVGLMLHREAGFSLSLLEPMMLGTPTIIQDESWSRALLGDEYPFYCSTQVQAYALLERFYQDYAGEYAKFVEWHTKVFIPLFNQRFKDDLIYDVLYEYMNQFNVVPQFIQNHPDKINNQIYQLVEKAVKGREDFVLFDVLNEMAEAGIINSLADKTAINCRDKKGLVWSTAWNELRITLKAFGSWEDASVKVGHMKRIKT